MLFLVDTFEDNFLWLIYNCYRRLSFFSKWKTDLKSKHISYTITCIIIGTCMCPLKQGLLGLFLLRSLSEPGNFASTPAHWVCLLLCEFCTQSTLWPPDNLSFFVDFPFCVLCWYIGILQNCVLTCSVLILKSSRFVCELNLLFQCWKPKFSIVYYFSKKEIFQVYCLKDMIHSRYL